MQFHTRNSKVFKLITKPKELENLAVALRILNYLKGRIRIGNCDLKM
jgi:hypothetical protein